MKLEKFFALETEASKKEFRETLPFFFLITLVLIWMYIQMVITAPPLADPLRRIVFTFLMLVHLVLYWRSFWASNNDQRTIYYFVAQGILAFLLVLISEEIGLAIALFTSLIGNMIGILGSNKKLLLAGVIFFTSLVFVTMVLLTDSETLEGFLPIFIVAAAFASFFAYLFNRQFEARTQTQGLLQELEDANQQLVEYTSQVESLTLSTERQRMARELHDTLAQGLAGLILQLETIDIHFEKENVSKGREILSQAISEARSTMIDARRAIDDLRAEAFGRQSLAEAVSREAERFEKATGIACEYSLHLSEPVSEQLYEHIVRIISEGLSNIARHAQAHQAQLEVVQAEDGLMITIKDNGRGFDLEAAGSRPGHYGLLGIRERVRLAGGSMTLDSVIGEGTRLQVQLPLWEQADE